MSWDNSSKPEIVSDDEILDPTPQQRAIYKFHEERFSDQADEIYSKTWSRRSRSWGEEFGASEREGSPLNPGRRIEDMPLGAFYVEHPVAAYSLWRMLEELYGLDRIICGNSEEERVKIAAWKKLKPFEYLKSKDVREKWKRSTQVLKRSIQDGKSKGNPLVMRLNEILGGMQNMEDAFDALKESFSINLKDVKSADEMLRRIGEGLDERRTMIADILKPKENN